MGFIYWGQTQGIDLYFILFYVLITFPVIISGQATIGVGVQINIAQVGGVISWEPPLFTWEGVRTLLVLIM